MKHHVPAAPQPSFGDTQFGARKSLSATPRATMPPLDAAFLNRVFATMLWFGALLSLCAGSATKSVAVGASFEVGTLLAALLLKSQAWFMRRLVAQKSRATQYRGWDARFPLWMLVPLKYLAVATLIGAGLKLKILVPEAFAAGFTVLQIVIWARVAGRFLKARVSPIDFIDSHAHR